MENHDSSAPRSLEEIASWLIPSLQKTEKPTVTLPALQRGAVWKPSQIELLWDSMLRGFPVGAIMLAPYNSEKGVKAFFSQSHNSSCTKDPTYHLLDGQQRCNAIALGWINHLYSPEETAPLSLWIDLSPPENGDDRDFIFRVVTSSHCWGYQRNDPSQRLPAKKRREALQAFHKATIAGGAEIVSKKAKDLPLSRAWPWDARTPVPVPLLLNSILFHQDDSLIWSDLEQKLKSKIPYWNKEVAGIEWTNEVREILNNPTEYMKEIVLQFRQLLTQYKIPILILPDKLSGNICKKEQERHGERQDPVATWFIRVNSAGTPITGEELMYSILKSDWPDAEKAIESLSERLMSPPRLLLLVSRLILARKKSKNQQGSPPASPNVQQFRRLIHGTDPRCPDFKDQIREFFESGKGCWMFATVRTLLVHPKKRANINDHRLPPILVTEIASQSPDIFFFLLAWLDRMKKKEIKELSLNTKKRVLGFITATAWFSTKTDLCLKFSWKRLMETTEQGRTANFFAGKPLKNALKLSKKREIGLIPLPTPVLLDEAVKNLVTEARGSRNPGNQWWKNWEWWEKFSGLNDNFNKLPENLKNWYENELDCWQVNEDDEGSSKERLLDAWDQFVNNLWGQKSLVLYAQREWLIRWFEDYDPTNPLQQEDADRPWDMDHIHPQKYIYKKRNIPQIIKDWHGSIGNLRAWPFEMNRSDGEIPPRYKLAGIPKQNEYSMDTESSLQEASFIKEEWKYWQDSTPPNEEQPRGNYLNMIDSYPDCQKSLIDAITCRWVALYREWYDTLLIEKLI